MPSRYPKFKITVECTGEAVVAITKFLKASRWLGAAGASRMWKLKDDGVGEEMRSKGYHTDVYFDGDGASKILSIETEKLEDV